MEFVLEWKEFSVDLDKVHKHLKSILSSNFDGLRCDSDSLKVVFFETIESEDEEALSDYWENVSEEDFQQTIQEMVSTNINNAVIFGNKLINDAIVENVLLGITQLGKTKEVADYLHKLSHYLTTGSLYAAINEIDTLIAAGLPGNLSPFVTLSRLNNYKSQIQGYLGL